MDDISEDESVNRRARVDDTPEDEGVNRRARVDDISEDEGIFKKWANAQVLHELMAVEMPSGPGGPDPLLSDPGDPDLLEDMR